MKEEIIFYTLDKKPGCSYYGCWIKNLYEEYIKTDIFKRYGRYPPMDCFELELKNGNMLADIMRGDCLIVNERTKNIFIENNIKGYNEIVPVTFVDKSIKEKYYRFNFRRHIWESESKKLLLGKEINGKVYKKDVILFDKNQIDGEDIVTFYEGYGVYISEKLKKVIEENNISGVRIGRSIAIGKEYKKSKKWKGIEIAKKVTWEWKKTWE